MSRYRGVDGGRQVGQCTQPAPARLPPAGPSGPAGGRSASRPNPISLDLSGWLPPARTGPAGWMDQPARSESGFFGAKISTILLPEGARRYHRSLGLFPARLHSKKLQNGRRSASRARGFRQPENSSRRVLRRHFPAGSSGDLGAGGSSRTKSGWWTGGEPAGRRGALPYCRTWPWFPWGCVKQGHTGRPGPRRGTLSLLRPERTRAKEEPVRNGVQTA